MHASVGTQVWFPEIKLLYVSVIQKKKLANTQSPRSPCLSVCDVTSKSNKSIEASTEADFKKIPKLLLNNNSCQLNHSLFEKYLKIKTQIRTAINTLDGLSVPKSNGGSNTNINVGQLYKAILRSCFAPCFFNSSVCCDDQHPILLRSLQACKII